MTDIDVVLRVVVVTTVARTVMVRVAVVAVTTVARTKGGSNGDGNKKGRNTVVSIVRGGG